MEVLIVKLRKELHLMQNRIKHLIRLSVVYHQNQWKKNDEDDDKCMMPNDDIKIEKKNTNQGIILMELKQVQRE